MKPKCSAPECKSEGLVRIETGEWWCSRHMQEAANMPSARALTQADEDMEVFRDAGGKLN